MGNIRITRIAGIFAALATTAACATSPSPWDHQEPTTAVRPPSPERTSSLLCPVVPTNGTDGRLDAGYRVNGIESVLGVIQAGRSLSFGVSCDADPIEAFGVAPSLFLGDGPEYRTVASVRPGEATRMGFTLVNRVR